MSDTQSISYHNSFAHEQATVFVNRLIRVEFEHMGMKLLKSLVHVQLISCFPRELKISWRRFNFHRPKKVEVVNIVCSKYFHTF